MSEYPKCKNSKKTHLKLFGTCCSFVSACTQDWCYNSGLWQARWTEVEEEVTCARCKKFIKECADMVLAEQDEQLFLPSLVGPS
jgi:hypothetical protein